MLMNTEVKYCGYDYDCEVDHSVNDDLCVIDYGTDQWEEDYVVQPLDTFDQRRVYRKLDERFRTKSMGRGEAAAMFETLALNAQQIEQWLSIADALYRLAMNSPAAGYMDLTLEGFDELEVSRERAMYVLGEVSSHGSWGGWPTSTDPIGHDQFMREVGAAIRATIDPAWSTELRARLVHFSLLEAEEYERLTAR